MQKTADVLYDEIKEQLNSFNVTEIDLIEKVTFITDRGTNIKSALESRGVNRLSCFAHLVNNLVGKMCKVNIVKQQITYAARLFKYMKISGLNVQLKRTLKSFCTTRWNTVYDLFKSVYENYSCQIFLPCYLKKKIQVKRE